jgi:diadenylate cyclase
VTEAWHILQPGWRDIIDIAVVGMIFYQIYRLMKGTRAVPMFVGLLLILFAYAVVQMMELALVSLIFKEFATVWAIAIVILFQPELRRFLIQMGNNPIVAKLFPLRAMSVIEEIARAASILSDKQYGGLFVLTREVGIRATLESGVRLQSEVSKELLVSIFFPRTPLHDGAVVISGSLVLAARCILPLSNNPGIDPSYGTRHRAALGISEESDAVVVVVSEETGKMSLAVGGRLLPVQDENALVHTLQRIFSKQTV